MQIIHPVEYYQPQHENDPVSIRRTRALNDTLRLTGAGGVILESPAVRALPEATREAVRLAIQSFDDFNSSNDPHKEHDCAIVRVEGDDFLFKIDYYDSDCIYHSPDKASPFVTKRVMTICTPIER